jgi:Zn-dependent protease
MRLTAESFYVTLVVYVGWIVSLCFHEFGHAIVAYWGGDYSVKEKGYLSFNPLKYVHPILSIVLPMLYLLLGGFGLPGGAVYIDDAALRRIWWSSLVSLAGPVANILVAIALSIPFQFGWMSAERLDLQNLNVLGSESWFANAIALLVYLQISAALFNLLPVPGLDGYGILEPWLPRTWTWKLAPLKQYGIFIVLLVITIPAVSSGLVTSGGALLDLLGVPKDLLYLGYQQFRGAAALLGIGVLILFFIAWKTQFFPRLRRWQQQQLSQHSNHQRDRFNSHSEDRLGHRSENRIEHRSGDRKGDRSKTVFENSKNPVQPRPKKSRRREESRSQEKIITFPTPSLTLPPIDRSISSAKQECHQQLTALLQQRKTQTAIEDLNQFANAHPQDPDLADWEAIVLFHHGCWQLREFQFAAAQRSFDRALQLVPKHEMLQAEIQRAKATIQGMN